MAEESFLGLGAGMARKSFSSLSQESPTTPSLSVVAANPKDSKGTTNATEELVSRYMKQCLDYHHEQIRLERICNEPLQNGKKEQENHQGDNQQNKKQEGRGANILSSAHNVSAPAPPTAKTTQIQITSSEETTTMTDNGLSLDAHRRIKNAREIAQRFASIDPRSVGTLNHSMPHPINCLADKEQTTNGTEHANTPSTSTMVYPYSKKRKDFLTNVHQKRLQASLLKNLNYLVEKDTELHERQMLTIQQTKEHSLGLKLHNDRVLSERRRQLQQNAQGKKVRKRNRFGEVPNPVAGIGTRERKNAERRNVAVYIAGLPRDSSTDKVETSVRQLFASYGIVSRVVLYVDKKTGQRKGDGLVVYDYPQSEDGKDIGGNGRNDNHKHDSFLDTVCTQLNGAELPCGSVLLVEPADTNYRQKDAPKKNEMTPNSSSVVGDDKVKQNVATEDPMVKVAEKDDLDDFFASLE